MPIYLLDLFMRALGPCHELEVNQLILQKWKHDGLTIRPSRRRFTTQLNSGASRQGELAAAGGILELVFGALEISLGWRSALLTLIGLSAGLAHSFDSAQEPSSAAIAFAHTIVGAVADLIRRLAARTGR